MLFQLSNTCRGRLLFSKVFDYLAEHFEAQRVEQNQYSLIIRINDERAQKFQKFCEDENINCEVVEDDII